MPGITKQLLVNDYEELEEELQKTLEELGVGGASIKG